MKDENVDPSSAVKFVTCPKSKVQNSTPERVTLCSSSLRYLSMQCPSLELSSKLDNLEQFGSF